MVWGFGCMFLMLPRKPKALRTGGPLVLVQWCAALVLFCFADHGFAAEHPLAPSPSALDIPYSADNPPGPSFTAEEKERQYAEGARIVAGVRAAFLAGLESYVIPPGDYRFDSAHGQTGGRSFALQGMHAKPEKPFRILGYGATFWFSLSAHAAPHHHQMIKVFDCSHLSLEGLTVDSDPRGSMDARITAFDFEGNRIQVKPVAGTRLLERLSASEGRFIPFKADGRHVAALYQIDEGWGPGNMFTRQMEKTPEGLYWFTLKERKLLATLRNEAWKAAYGSAGTLEVGDMLGFIYSSSSAIVLNDCREIVVRDSRFFAAKSGLDESNGHGGHRWINCHFMARPGTNNLLGGDGTMMNAGMHGSVMERCVIQRTTDDAFNNHGYWKHAASVAERSITFREGLPKSLAAGQVAEAFEARTDAYLARLTVESVEGKTVRFREPIGAKFATAAVMFPAYQNAGWVIRDSIFCDSYQRVLLGCGPGLFEGNRIERVGAGLTLGNGRPIDIEGGDPHGVVIRGNVFLDSGSSPALRAVRIHGTGAPLRGLQVCDNLFVGTGSGAVSVNNAEGPLVRDNIAIHPAVGLGLLRKPGAAEPFSLKRVTGAETAGNVIVQPAALADGLAVEVRRMAGKHEVPAKEIISEVRRKLAQQPAK
jgi:hypothetical protein